MMNSSQKVRSVKSVDYILKSLNKGGIKCTNRILDNVLKNVLFMGFLKMLTDARIFLTFFKFGKRNVD